MLSSVEQAFVGRDEKRAPLKTPAWEVITSGEAARNTNRLVPPPFFLEHGSSAKTLISHSQKNRQLRRLCGPQFLSYLPKHFTNLRRSLFGDAILVDRTVHQYGRRKSTKTSRVHFFYKSSFFSLEG